MKVPFVDLVAQWAPLKDDILKDWEDILDNASFVGGGYLDDFEEALASFCVSRFAIGVSSGTSALTCILRGLGIGPGDRVAVQAETFIATAYAVKQVGAEPVLVEPSALNFHVIKNFKAVIVVHIYGEVDKHVCTRLADFCDRAGVYLIEDACQAIGCDGVGDYGIASAFSFYPAKNLGCAGQGGGVITNDEILATRVRQFVNQGWIADGTHAPLAGNERLHSLQAAVLLRGIRKLDEWNSRRMAIAQMYDAGLPDNVWPMVTPGSNCVYHLYPVRVMSPEVRDDLSAHLNREGVANARHYPKAISQQDGFRSAGFKGLEKKLSCHLTLPMFPTMTDEQVEYVIKSINDWSKHV